MEISVTVTFSPSLTMGSSLSMFMYAGAARAPVAAMSRTSVRERIFQRVLWVMGILLSIERHNAVSFRDAAHPFSAPIITPRTKCFCTKG